jgi:DNA-binding transcriptional ArsR family regulator
MVSESDDHLDAVFQALSDRTRRALLARLAEGPASVGELAAPHPMSLAAVSKHLSVLTRAGLITRTREGRIRRCDLNAATLREAHGWLTHYQQFWDERLAALAQYVEALEPSKEDS